MEEPRHDVFAVEGQAEEESEDRRALRDLLSWRGARLLGEAKTNKNKATANPPSAAKPGDPPKAEAAFEQIKPEMAKLAPESLGRINLDISQAVSIALGVLLGLQFLRPALAKPTDFDLARFDELETYALGAWYARLLALPPASATDPVQPVLEEASALRISRGPICAIRAHAEVVAQSPTHDLLHPCPWSPQRTACSRPRRVVRLADDPSDAAQLALAFRGRG